MLTITSIICFTVSFIIALFQHLFNEQIKNSCQDRLEYEFGTSQTAF